MFGRGSELTRIPSWSFPTWSADVTVDGRMTSWKIARSRISNRVQITTDGHKAYLEAVENAFGCGY